MRENFWSFLFQPTINFCGGGSSGGGGGGGGSSNDSGGSSKKKEKKEEKVYNSLAEAAKDGKHGQAVNIKGKGLQKVEFADKSYDDKMKNASDNVNKNTTSNTSSSSSSNNNKSNTSSNNKNTTTKKDTTYKVKSGDTLGQIALDNGTTVAAIAKASGIDLKDVNNINVNQKLTIPVNSNKKSDGTNKQNIYADLPKNVFEEKTPKNAITVDGKYYDAFGNEYATKKDRDAGEVQAFRQESWSNPANWIVTADERGNLDKQYIGDEKAPAGGKYTVPSFDAINKSTSKPKDSLDITINDKGQAVVLDKAGREYTNLDSAIAADKKIDTQVASYSDPNNYRIDANNRDELELVYVGDEKMPPAGVDYKVPNFKQVDKAQEGKPDADKYYDLSFEEGKTFVIDDYGNKHNTVKEANASSTKITRQIESWSNPKNYIITTDERGNIDKQYIGDEKAPSGGQYKVPSFKDINKKTSDKSSSLDVQIDNKGKAYVTDELGNKYTNVDKAAANDAKIQSYSDETNYGITLDDNGNPQVTYTGQYSPPTGKGADNYVNAIRPEITTVRGNMDQVDLSSGLTDDMVAVLQAAGVTDIMGAEDDILPSDLSILADAGYKIDGDLALKTITGATSDGSGWSDRRSAAKALNKIGYTTESATGDLLVIPGARISQPLRIKIGGDGEAGPANFRLRLENGYEQEFSEKPTQEEILEIMREQGYQNVEPLLIPKGTNIALAEDALNKVASDLELTPFEPDEDEAMMIDIISEEEFKKLYDQDTVDFASENLVEYVDMKSDNQLSKESVDSLLSKGSNWKDIVDTYTDFTGTTLQADGSSVEQIVAESAFSESLAKDGSGNAALMYLDPMTGEVSRTADGNYSQRAFVDIQQPLTVDGILTESGSQQLTETLGESRVAELRSEYEQNGTVTFSDDDKQRIEDSGFDSVVVNDTQTVSVFNEDNIFQSNDTSYDTESSEIAYREEWKNEIDKSYAENDGFNVTDINMIKNEYDVEDDSFVDYRGEYIDVDEDWKQDIVDEYFDKGTISIDTIESLQDEYNLEVDDLDSFYKDISDPGITGVYEDEIDRIRTAVTAARKIDLGRGGDGNTGVLGGSSGTARPEAEYITNPEQVTRLDTGQSDSSTEELIEMDEFGNPVSAGGGTIPRGSDGRPIGTYITQPTQPVGPFAPASMSMPEVPSFSPQQARLGAQPTTVGLDQSGFITESDPTVTEPTQFYNPQFNQVTQVPAGTAVTNQPLGFIEGPAPAIKEVTPETVGSFLGKAPPQTGVT